MGQWEEDHQLFAYVRRLDDLGDISYSKFECFVAKTDEEGHIHLAESGSNCRRNLQVSEVGMKLIKQRKFFWSGQCLAVGSCKRAFPATGENTTYTILISGTCFGLPVNNTNSSRKPWFVHTTNSSSDGEIAVITADDINKIHMTPMTGKGYACIIQYGRAQGPQICAYYIPDVKSEVQRLEPTYVISVALLLIFLVFKIVPSCF